MGVTLAENLGGHAHTPGAPLVPTPILHKQYTGTVTHVDCSASSIHAKFGIQHCMSIQQTLTENVHTNVRCFHIGTPLFQLYPPLEDYCMQRLVFCATSALDQP